MDTYRHITPEVFPTPAQLTRHAPMCIAQSMSISQFALLCCDPNHYLPVI